MVERKQTTVAQERADEMPVAESRAAAASDYVVPVLHVHVSDKVMAAGFWGGLAGAVMLGAVDLPLGVLVGAAVVMVRHQRN